MEYGVGTANVIQIEKKKGQSPHYLYATSSSNHGFTSSPWISFARSSSRFDGSTRINQPPSYESSASNSRSSESEKKMAQELLAKYESDEWTYRL